VTQPRQVGILLAANVYPKVKLALSEKRPETEADILSRSKLLTSAQINRVPSPGQRRRYTVDLPAHMAECDANYHRLLRLFPNLRDTDEQRIGLLMPTMNAEVSFVVLEKGPYTTLLQLDVESDEKWMQLATAPSMTVRVYHDAQSAEVVSYQTQNRFHGVYEYPNTRMRQRDEKVQINRFLGEFLSLCLEHGASTTPISF
jgi:uncharacterized protein YqiB (DUF1249 family)